MAKNKVPEVEMQAVNKRTRKPVDASVLETSDIAFDPTTQHLDLSKDQKRRTTALMLAINAYDHLIIKDAEMYRAAKDDERRNEGPKIRPATINAMVEAAMQFDWFISGDHLQPPFPASPQSEDVEEVSSNDPANL